MLSSCANAQDTRYTLSISQLPNYCCFAYRVAALNKSLLSGYTLSISQWPRSFSWSCQAASLDQRARGHWAEIRMRTSYDLKWPNYSSWVSPYRKNTSRSKALQVVGVLAPASSHIPVLLIMTCRKLVPKFLNAPTVTSQQLERQNISTTLILSNQSLVWLRI